jgi:hypothetical protein
MSQRTNSFDLSAYLTAGGISAEDVAMVAANQNLNAARRAAVSNTGDAATDANTYYDSVRARARKAARDGLAAGRSVQLTMAGFGL